MDGNTVTITLTLSDGNTVEQSFKVYNGASAYEVWLQAGNTGTEQDYLDSLKGEPGQDGQPAEGSVLSVDAILPDSNGELVLSAPREIHIENKDITLDVSMTGIQNRGIYVSVTNGLLTLNLTDWDSTQIHPMARVRMVLESNSAGQFVVRGSGATKWVFDLDGVHRYMLPMDIPTAGLTIIDIVNTLGSVPALVWVYPSQYPSQ